MKTKRTYFGFTTPQQRKLLFETWQATGKVTEACKEARVSRSLFYYWKDRFDEKGYAGLEEYESRAAHRLNCKEEAIEQKVVEMRMKNPNWGKVRISDEMAKANNWVPVVSANTVKRMLKKANLWPEKAVGEKIC